MVIPYSNLDLLLPHYVLFWPICVVFPGCRTGISMEIDNRNVGLSNKSMYTHLTISLDSTIRFSSLTTRGETYTEIARFIQGASYDVNITRPRASRSAERTLFANQTVVAVIRVVCIAQPPIVIFEFEELVPMSPGVARTDQCNSTNIVGI